MLAGARAAGATTSLDTNWDPAGTWGDGQLRASMAQTDVMLPNEREAVRIAGEPTLSAAAGALTAAGPRLAVKLGERGVLCADGPVWHRVELPPVTPVDTTGAGDCFNAGLIAGLLRGLALPDAAALGCAVGALSTQAPGGTASSPDLASALELARTATVRRVSGGMPSS
jgi:sugar/nucleoside kinase (ribokinase family)